MVRIQTRACCWDGHPHHTTAVELPARSRRPRADPAQPVRARDDAALTLIKAAHTLAWFSIESCMAYVLYAGAARRTDRRTALAGAVVAGECLVFAANGFRCPLTQLAEKIGAADGSVTDIWLPRWFARNLPAIHAPLLAAAAYLNGRNLRERQRPDPLRNHRRPPEISRGHGMVAHSPGLGAGLAPARSPRVPMTTPAAGTAAGASGQPHSYYRAGQHRQKQNGGQSLRQRGAQGQALSR